MDAVLTPPPLPQEKPAAPPLPKPPPVAAKGRIGIRRLLLRILRGLKSWLLAAISCLSVPFAVVFSGWTYRLVQRRALTRWARHLDDSRPSDRILPRWIVAEDFRGTLARARTGGLFSRIRAVLRAFLGSLGANLKTGFLVVLNSFLLTLPGGMIMLFSWYAGWDNSFNKGYEQAAVGPLWGFIGIFLFMAAMTYVPIAQARQAVTGSAKAFWNYRKVREVVSARPIGCLLLVAGYAATGFVFMIAMSALYFIGNGDGFAELTIPQIVAYLNSYYFWWAVLFLVPAFVLLRLAAGRLYSGAALDLVADGTWKKDELCATEVEALANLPLRVAPPQLPGLLRTSLRTFSAVGRVTLRTAAFLLLFGFATQLYVAQFFNYNSTTWIRQPMVQLPWFHSIPEHLQE